VLAAAIEGCKKKKKIALFPVANAGADCNIYADNMTA
jgi:hypothetical protein